MEQSHTKAYYGYALVHQGSATEEPETRFFGAAAFCEARESYLKRHEGDTHRPRKGHFTTGYFPYSQLFFVVYDAERTEVERHRIMGNRHQAQPFGRVEPMATTLLMQRNAGLEWFLEDDDEQRVFFQTEADAVDYLRAHAAEGKWQVYNLDKHLDHMEGRSIQHFLTQRSALSTNQLEILADLGRGTLSKIKNGQRILSRKQYGRIVRVLQHYGYVAWVDLRQLEAS